MSNNLNTPDLAANSSQPEVPLNATKARFDDAITETASFDVGNDDAHTLADEDFRTALVFTANEGSPGTTGAWTLTVGAIKRGLFILFNNTANDGTVTIASQPVTAPVVAAGSFQVLACDGTNVRTPTAAAVTAFLGLTDTPSSYSGQALKALRVNAGANALEFTDFPSGGSIIGTQQLTAGFKGAMAVVTSGQSIADSTDVTLAWDAIEYDTGHGGTNFFDLGTDATIITIPTGVTKVRITGACRVDLGSLQLTLQRDAGGGFAIEDVLTFTGQSTGSELSQNFATGVINVSAGDEFRIIARLTGGASPSTVQTTNAYFAVEVLETNDSVSLQAIAVATKPRFKGALAILTADNTALNASSLLKTEWDDTVYDTGVSGTAFFDNANDRLTVPPGVSFVKLNAQISISNATDGQRLGVFIVKNGSRFVGGGATMVLGGISGNVSAETPVIPVVPGDYFETQIFSGTDTSVDVIASVETSFGIEVIEEVGATDVPSAFIAVQPKHKGVLAKTNTAQSITSATVNAIEFDSAVYDTTFNPGDGGPDQRFWLGVDQTFTTVDTGDDHADVTAHGFQTGEGPFRLTTSGTLPTGLATSTDYWAINASANELRFATSRANALAGTAVDITGAGSGTHTIETETWLVVPANVTKVRLTGHVDLTGSTGDAVLAIRKNDALGADGTFWVDHANTTDADQVEGTTAVIEVSEGDRFELVINPASGTVTLNNGDLDSYLFMEVIESGDTLSFPGVTVERPHIGVSLRHSTTQGSLAASTSNPLNFDTELYDTGHRGVPFHDTVTNNSRITIPAGVTKVKLEGGGSVNITTDAVDRSLEFLLNGASMTPRVISRDASPGGTSLIHSLASGVIEVSEGDYFEIAEFHGSGTGTTVNGVNWFTMTVVETEDAAFPPEPVEVYLDTAAWNGAAFPTSAPVYKKVAARRFSLHDDLSGSQGQADNGPNGGAVAIDVQRNGSSIGTITFADSTGAAQTATFTTAGGGQEDFEVGDRLELVGPANWQSMDEVVISLWAFRT